MAQGVILLPGELPLKKPILRPIDKVHFQKTYAWALQHSKDERVNFLSFRLILSESYNKLPDAVFPYLNITIKSLET